MQERGNPNCNRNYGISTEKYSFHVLTNTEWHKTQCDNRNLNITLKSKFSAKTHNQINKEKAQDKLCMFGSGLSHMTNSLCKSQCNLETITRFLKS